MTRFAHSLSLLLTAALFCVQHVFAIDVDLDDDDSIKSVAKTIAGDMMTYYHGHEPGKTPGLLDPYYWWEAGALFGQLIEYWYYTGDDTYNDIVTEGLLFQVGPRNDFMPPNQTATEGNDDQVFWAFAAMSAAEMNFPDPPSSQPQWLALAQAVFNEQVSRWETTTCGGGLRWQIQSFAPGWTYKNTPSNAGLFQLAARLAQYTRNSTYADWAEKVYDWMSDSPILYKNYTVFDGTSIDNGCKDANQLQWSYNYGQMIAGSAYMWNYTNGSEPWSTRLDGFLNQSMVLFPEEYSPQRVVMVEVACEVHGTCNIDQPSFKAYLARWLATAAQIAPFVQAKIMPLLRGSAKGAAGQCVGGASGRLCGRQWWRTDWDGNQGIGEQMSALSVICANLIKNSRALVGSDSGGTSKGDPGAGNTGDIINVDSALLEPITTGDRAGAGILTAIVLAAIVGGGLFMSF